MQPILVADTRKNFSGEITVIETFTLLITAHILADFVFQTDWMVSHKNKWWVFLLHIFTVAILSSIALGKWNHPIIATVVVSHFVIDLIKCLLFPEGLTGFVLDQILHLEMIAFAVMTFQSSIQDAWWAPLLLPGDHVLLMKSLTILCGAVLAIKTGGIIVSTVVKSLLTPDEYEQIKGGFLLKSPTENAQPKGLPNGGRLIGYLERGLVLLLIWNDQASGIGFVITAKSILRFGDIKDSHNRRVTEYIIIGTLLSFGWAIFIGTVVQRLVRLW